MMEFETEQGRIFARDEAGKLIAEITFPADGRGVAQINHTFVDDSLRGQGVAAQLVSAAVETLRAENRHARVTCSYARKWAEQHPEAKDVLL